MRGILEAAARSAAAIARTLLYKPRDRRVYIFDDGSWKTAFVGGSYEFLANGARMLDYRALMHYVGTGITPAMTHAAPGIGSQYAYTVDDANGETLDGGNNYTLTLPRRSPSRRSGRSTSTTPRPAHCCRPTTPTRASTTASATSTPKPTATSSSASDPNRPPTPTSTGCEPSPARAGSRSSASTAPSKPGSTKPGDPARSNMSRPIRGVVLPDPPRTTRPTVTMAAWKLPRIGRLELRARCGY